ncbi:flagellar hook-associated protein 3 [Clostridium sp. 2-1]|uniref:flagellar hook-associated protein FlgL n=1 Tax=Clostridium TaxID=1485 RepID=UPI000CDB7C60|nr:MULTISPECIES: flagellar hook-associated protein FlgL [Clostridium]MBN7573077.1 flagellar hook-associated protein FlgL [Clostridium beijerinckii]MBN7578416.1 flagellar hook-associated protein FlgL [Clostridium beijerinckii]MBN7582851.1 flagellar hook-associated protein FlgL [Clostridium beijerinckii]MBO0519016.1 flagellar hook-associated protein FlgL [Clostridium beijerinckii]POO93281.1 flagellar hook-associated protein 3 [Clostridium sp. 2-1]
MSFRITNSMLSSNYLRNVKRNMNNMQTLQNQLASGKEINKASDNPYVASRSMQLNAEISYNKQYDENIKDTSNWLDTTDTALSQMGSIFGRIETLLVNAGNGTYGDDEKSAIKDEIKEKVNELSQVLNTSFDGSYIFGGTKTNSKPTTVVDGKLEYADKDGNFINVYKQSNGTITTSATTSNISYTLTASDITLLNSELNNTTSPPSDARKTEINTLILAGVGASEYKSVDGTITTSATSTNKQVGLTMADVTALQNELNNTTSPPNAARKNEINNILTQATPITQINSSLEVDITQGVKSIYNKTAVDVLEFKDKNGKSINVSDLLSNIVNDLGTNGSGSNLITNDLNDIQSVTANLLQKRSEVGTMQNRMDSAQTNNETQNYNMTDILSKTEDVDFANKTMEYSMMQTVYTASLQTSAKILPMTILNYL